MLTYLVRRLAWGLGVLIAVGAVTFLLTYIVPGDPAKTIAGLHASPADVQRIRVALGLDQPFPVQVAAYVGRVLRLDFGMSTSLNTPVSDLLISRFPATAQLALGGVAIGVLIGLPLGMLAAARRGRWTDRLISMLSAVMIAAPIFWVALLVQYGFGTLPKLTWKVDLFAINGYQAFDPRHLFLPCLALGLLLAGAYIRLVRAALLEELSRDYTRTARAKGLPPSRVVWRHAMRNAASPLLAQLGLDIGILLGGVVIVEKIFSFAGVGKLAADSFQSRDVPLIMGTVMFGTIWIVLANLAADLIQAVLDPRIRTRTI